MFYEILRRTPKKNWVHSKSSQNKLDMYKTVKG